MKNFQSVASLSDIIQVCKIHLALYVTICPFTFGGCAKIAPPHSKNLVVVKKVVSIQYKRKHKNPVF